MLNNQEQQITDLLTQFQYVSVATLQAQMMDHASQRDELLQEDLDLLSGFDAPAKQQGFAFDRAARSISDYVRTKQHLAFGQKLYGGVSAQDQRSVVVHHCVTVENRATFDVCQMLLAERDLVSLSEFNVISSFPYSISIDVQASSSPPIRPF
jgi:hypothetical protein